MKKKIKNNILKKIKTGDVKMRSRLDVLAQNFGIRSVIILVLFGLIILSGFASYWFSLNSDLIFGGYGRYGFRIFTGTFPYALLITFAGLFLMLVFALRKFDFSYKKPFIVILSAIAVLVLILGWFSLNNPVGRGFYRNEGRFLGMGRMMNNANSVNGRVMEIDGKEIILMSADGENVIIKISGNTHYPFGIPKAGDSIRCVGIWKGNYFEAVGIRVFDEDDVNGMIGRQGNGGMMNGQGRGPGRKNLTN